MKKYGHISQTAGGIVVNRKTHKIALIQMEDKIWSFPKGRFKEGEKIIDAARREVHEETGIKNLKLIKELPTYERENANDSNILKVIHMHLFYTDEDKLNPIENDIVDSKWIDKKDMLNTLTLEKDREYFEKITNNI